MPLELLQGHLLYKIDTEIGLNVKSAQRKIPVDLHFIVRLRHKETAGVACGPVDVAGGRDAATLGLWRH